MLQLDHNQSPPLLMGAPSSHPKPSNISHLEYKISYKLSWKMTPPSTSASHSHPGRTESISYNLIFTNTPLIPFHPTLTTSSLAGTVTSSSAVITSLIQLEWKIISLQHLVSTLLHILMMHNLHISPLYHPPLPMWLSNVCLFDGFAKIDNT